MHGAGLDAEASSDLKEGTEWACSKVDHLCTTIEVSKQHKRQHLVTMTRPEDGRDGGIYSSDSAGQTPSLASIYQVGRSFRVKYRDFFVMRNYIARF